MTYSDAYLILVVTGFLAFAVVLLAVSLWSNAAPKVQAPTVTPAKRPDRAADAPFDHAA